MFYKIIVKFFHKNLKSNIHILAFLFGRPLKIIELH